ncbi:MAG: GldG family protein [Candidatus Rokubacteria bacterium]|nr:GldG family protein [Candidatus Rokubacteria bacterium]
MKRIATPALVLGLIGLFGGLVLRQYRPSWAVAWPAALIVGGLLALLGLYASFPNAREVWGRRTTRYGLNALVMVVLILGVIALVEAVSYRHNWRLDLTENKRQSLSPQTAKVLKELKTPVKAVAFLRPDIPGKRVTEDRLKLYAANSDGKFRWETVDLDSNPSRALRYGATTYGTIVLEAERAKGDVREEKVQDAEEETLTNALIRVTREGKRAVHFLKGHGEKDLASSERAGLSQLKAALEKVNYEAKELLLARESKVPDDAAIVVVAGPDKDLLPNEVDALTKYVGRGGRLLVLVDPFKAPGMATFLERYGLGLGNDVIIDVSGLGRMFDMGPEVPIAADYPSHPITQGFRLITVYPVARTVSVKDKPPDGVTVQALARTSPESWAETNQEEIRTGQVKPDPGEARGPLAVAAAATIDAKDAAGDQKGAKARLVVVGDSDFTSNYALNAQGNRDFVLNALAWLAGEENVISIRPKEARNMPVFLTATQGYVLFWLPVVALPAAIVAAGVLAVVRKRGK